LEAQLILQPVAAVVVEKMVENVELTVVLVAVAAHLLELVDVETLLQQVPLKETMVVIKFIRDQVMVVVEVAVTLRLVLMVHRVQVVLVEQEQILVQHMETLAQHVQYSVVVAVVAFMYPLEPQELVEQVVVELGLMDQVVKLPEQQTLEVEVEVPDKEVLVH
tara:strand:- start:7 stop:495 length:489 start_codon:yes stop_codon:yes gene_type:complete